MKRIVSAGDGPSARGVPPDRADGREFPGELLIGSECIALMPGEVVVTVDPELGVRVRFYEKAEDEEPKADIAATAERAMRIAAIFARAALRADPKVKIPEVAEAGE